MYFPFSCLVEQYLDKTVVATNFEEQRRVFSMTGIIGQQRGHAILCSWYTSNLENH